MVGGPADVQAAVAAHEAMVAEETLATSVSTEDADELSVQVAKA